PSQVITLLLYPAIFAVGLTVGLVIGLQQGRVQGAAQQSHVNTSIIPGVNTNVKTNTTNANTNVSNAFSNTNFSLNGGDYLKLDAAAQTQLATNHQQEASRVIDQTASLTDIIRQQDILELKYNLLAYQKVEGKFPTTNGQVIHLDRSEADILYVAMRT